MDLSYTLTQLAETKSLLREAAAYLPSPKAGACSNGAECKPCTLYARIEAAIGPLAPKSPTENQLKERIIAP